jgi:hypothetical protein
VQTRTPPWQRAGTRPWPAGGLDLEALAQGLVRLGVGVRRSRQIVGAAVRALPRGEITEAGVLRRALALM